MEDGSTFAVDPGYYVSVYNVKSKDVADDETVSELVPGYKDDDGIEKGDMVFIRQHRMATREIFVIRFE